MTFEQMKIFLEAAHYGSFTHAAERLGLTQSAVSVSIKKLEQKHDVLLFDRSGRRLILTDAGQVFLNEAERILRDVEMTVRRIESHRATDPCAIVACTPNAYDFWMPEMFGRIRGEDNAQFDLVRGSADEIASWVMRGTADFGITSVVPSHPQFRQIGVFTDRLILCGHSEKARSISDGVAWAKLAEHGPILWEQGELAPALVSSFASNRVDVIRIAHPRLKLTSSMAVISALLSGQYLGFVPERAVRHFLESETLVRISHPEVVFRYWIFALRERELESLASRIAKAASRQ